MEVYDDIRIYLTNLGAYNRGQLKGKWVTLPMDIKEELNSIGVGRLDEGFEDEE